MKVIPFEQLACPLDREPLQPAAGGWACAAGHSFDTARQGYTHLLPVQHKRSREPGDSKPMVAARRRFLETGFYRPLAAALAEHVLPPAATQAPLAVLDAGCGEGYYLRVLTEMAEAKAVDSPLALLGLDISKWAVLAAARREKRVRWVVGTNAQLPVLDGSLDVIVCAFGFPVYEEFARALRTGGRVLLLEPGADHLRELRRIIYPELKPPRAPAGRAAARGCGFREDAQRNLQYSIDLESAETIADLLAMTPHLYRASPEGRARAAALSRLTLTVDVRLTTVTLG
jgi:23S rRNA (guanine745-N1)-methyltransferase